MRETASLKLQMNICELKKPVDWKQEWYTIIKFKKPFFGEVIQKRVQGHLHKSKTQTNPSNSPTELPR